MNRLPSVRPMAIGCITSVRRSVSEISSRTPFDMWTNPAQSVPLKGHRRSMRRDTRGPAALKRGSPGGTLKVRKESATDEKGVSKKRPAGLFQAGRSARARWAPFRRPTGFPFWLSFPQEGRKSRVEMRSCGGLHSPTILDSPPFHHVISDKTGVRKP